MRTDFICFSDSASILSNMRDVYRGAGVKMERSQGMRKKGEQGLIRLKSATKRVRGYKKRRPALMLALTAREGEKRAKPKIAVSKESISSPIIKGGSEKQQQSVSPVFASINFCDLRIQLGDRQKCCCRHLSH